MSWFYVDDGFHDHPKLDDLPPEMRVPAAGLWCLAGSWSRNKLTCGEVPRNRVLLLGGTLEQAEALCLCGLWVRTEKGYRFHEWELWQETPEEVQKRKEDGRKRTQKWRANKASKARKRRDASRDTSPTHHATRHQRVSDKKVLGEEEGEGTYKHEVRESFASTADAAITARAERALVELRCLAGGAR